jgi:hypothetical protein
MADRRKLALIDLQRKRITNDYSKYRKQTQMEQKFARIKKDMETVVRKARYVSRSPLSSAFVQMLALNKGKKEAPPVGEVPFVTC